MYNERSLDATSCVPGPLPSAVGRHAFYSCTPDLPAPPPAHRRRPPPPLLPPRPVQGNEKATCTSCRSARLIKLAADRRTQQAGSVHSQDLAPAPRLCTLASSTSGSDCEPFPGLLTRIRNRSDGARSVPGFSHLGISVASSDHPYLAHRHRDQHVPASQNNHSPQPLRRLLCRAGGNRGVIGPFTADRARRDTTNQQRQQHQQATAMSTGNTATSCTLAAIKQQC